MAVQQLGRDQARTLTDIIRGVSNVGGGITAASTKSNKPIPSASQEFFLPGQGPMAFSEFAQIAEPQYVEDNVRGKPSDFAGGLTEKILKTGQAIGQSVAKNYPGVTLAPTGQNFVRPNITPMSIFERSQMEADERDGIDDQLRRISESLGERKKIKPMTEAERIEMEQDEGFENIFQQPSGGATIDGAASTGTGTTTDGGSESSNANQAAQLEAAGIGAGTDDAGGKTDEPYNPYGEMLEKAMKDVAALRGKDPNAVTREEYMKEFAEATGVNISGEPDKSHALMAFGLALMQNKAGKGFDVSKMLGAVGEAGEKAMPAFQKAKEQARAERIAAGKYALGEVKADAAARASSLKAANARVNDLMKATIDTQAKIDLEGLKHKNKVELKIAELEVKAAEDAQKGKYDYKNTKTLEDKGLPGFKTTVGIRQTDGQSVFVNPEDEIGIFASALADVNEGADSLNMMRGIIIEEAKKTGGSNISRAKGFLEGVRRSFKFDMDQVPIFEKVTRKNEETGEEETVEVFTGRYEEKVPEAGALQTVDAIRDRVIAQFKRFLTQETGNGISNVDIQNIERLLGKIDFGSDPSLAIARIDEAMKIFESKKSKLENRISMYGNADRHRNQESYQETMRIGREALAQAYKLDPKVFRPSGTVEGDVEVFKLY